jgi:hypothetical protein
MVLGDVDETILTVEINEETNDQSVKVGLISLSGSHPDELTMVEHRVSSLLQTVKKKHDMLFVGSKPSPFFWTASLDSKI